MVGLNEPEETSMASPSGGTAVSVSDIAFSFGVVRAIDGIDLEVPSGSILSVFGPNGSGKTTLLRILSGLLRPARGRVTVLGESSLGEIEFRKKVGLVGHDTFVYADLTARENLQYYARLYGCGDRGRIEELLTALGLESVADRAVRGLSRGLVQRLSLGRALLHEPALLLLDEPFTGLDPQGSAVLSERLGDFRARGGTIVLSTHDLERGTSVADQAIVLHRGRIVWTSGERIPASSEMAVIYDQNTRAEAG